MTVTFTCTSTPTICASATITGGVVAVEYSGADQNNPLDSVSAGYSTAGNTTNLMDSGNVAPANSNLLVFGGGFADQNFPTTAGSGFTSHQASHGAWGTGLVEDNSSAISGNNVLQRATACIGTVASCPGSTAGNWLMQMAVFRDASWTVAGGWSPARVGPTLYADQFPGATPGDQIISAIAALPSQGGTVVAPSGSATETIASTVVIGTAKQPVTVILGPSFYKCTMTSGQHCFWLQGSGSKIKGLSQFATLIQPQSTFTGDVIHVEPPVQNAVIDIELAGFRIDLSAAPSVTAINLLSVRDPSHLHDIEIRNGLARALNIGTSANNSSCVPPDTNGCLSQGIGIDNTYIQTATSGTLTGHQVVVSGNQVEIGPNVKIINSGPVSGTYSGLVIQPSGLDVAEGLANSLFASSVGGYAICVLITASSSPVPNAGAQGNVIGPGNTFENCATGPPNHTGYGVELTGLDSTTHPALGNYVFGNYYTSSTENTVYLDYAKDNWIWEKGAAGNINLTTNSANNNIFSLVGQVTGTLTGNRVFAFPNAPISVSGGVFQDCGTNSTCANTVEPTSYVIRGAVTVSGTTSMSLTSLPFSSSSSYSCSGSDNTSNTGLVSFSTYTASSVTIQQTGGAAGNNLLKWQCSGY